MQALITSYLVQKKECNLPLLGHFRIKTKPADFEKDNKQIFPPTDEILYSEFAASLSEDLITYVSGHQNITCDEAEKKINNWCNEAKGKLDLGEKIIFNSIGSLQKDAVGNIFFQRKKQYSFYEPVAAGRGYTNTENTVSEAALKNGSKVINEFYRNEPLQKMASWKIWAIVLLSVSILMLFFYFYTHGFSEAGIGSHTSFPAQEPPVQHYAP